MIVSTSTPGKLILLGEYAVLEGAQAIVTAVNKFAKIIITKTDDNSFYINAPNLGIKELTFIIKNDHLLKFKNNLSSLELDQLSLFDKIFMFIYNFIKKQNIFPMPCDITIDTSDFYFENTNQKLGLGSSAAITVGLVDSLCKFNNVQFNNLHDLFDISLQAHYEAQGKIGSGIDIAASTFKGTGIFKKPADDYLYKNIALPQDLFIIPIWTGASTSTPEFVSKTNQLKNNDADIYNVVIKELSDLSNIGCSHLLNNESGDFLVTINKFYETLDKLGKSAGIPIISNSHKNIAEIVWECNGFYKPSGAGGNDIGIAFTNDLNIKKKIIERINTSQFKHIELETTEKSDFVKRN